MPEPQINSQLQEFRDACNAVVAEVRRVIVGHQQVIDQVLACLLSGGHALLEGVPGLGKTLLVRTLADALDLRFNRIQFTPDLMPADITGTNIVVTDPDGSKRFALEPGPIFANLVLADEINRATPKTQSAVLEAMQERTVSIARTSHPLDPPFCVLATQNPLEMEGTYPLPEAQLDRFMFKIRVEYGSVEELAQIVDRTTTANAVSVRSVLHGDRILQMRNLVREVILARDVKNYIARLVLATHPDRQYAPKAVRRYVRYGASPRAAQAIVLGAKVRALREGRANVAIVDVRSVVKPALRHRLILSFEGQSEGVAVDEIVDDVLEDVSPE